MEAAPAARLVPKPLAGSRIPGEFGSVRLQQWLNSGCRSRETGKQHGPMLCSPIMTRRVIRSPGILFAVRIDCGPPALAGWSNL